ncbi:MAG: hypothetical protein Kow0032_18640 [Methyloligellaceae bacterium]
MALIALLFILGEGERIERDLLKRSTAALQEQGYYWAQLKFEGRDGIMTGHASSPEERAKAIETVSSVSGVGTVRDRAKLLPVVKPYVWSANHKEGSVRVKGYVPGEAERQTILGIVRATLPGMEVEDRMKLAGGAPPRQRWIGAISFALKQLSLLKRGNARLVDMELILLGEALDAKSYTALNDALNAELPAGLTIKHHEILPPRAEPYAWGVKKQGGTVTVLGHVPDEGARQLVLEKVKENFIGLSVEDRMALASGAPKNWFPAVLVAITQVARLEEGEAVVQDTDFSISGKAADIGTAEAISRAIKEGLPDNFEAKNDVKLLNPDTSGDQPETPPGGKAEKTTQRFLAGDAPSVYLWSARPFRNAFGAGHVLDIRRHVANEEVSPDTIWTAGGLLPPSPSMQHLGR